MPGPLQGVRVLDLSVMISGPLAAMILADQGAEVIKVESPGLGDIMRFLGTNKGGMTGIFANNNRGKRSWCSTSSSPQASTCCTGSWPAATSSSRTSAPARWSGSG
jgi:crotonobetainyl-CoA:carnitine CoA-transferase CaiB-like acyl-CoA transferase